MKETKAVIESVCDFCPKSKKTSAAGQCSLCGKDGCRQHLIGIILPYFGPAPRGDPFGSLFTSFFMRGPDVQVCIDCMFQPLSNIVRGQLESKYNIKLKRTKK